MGGNSFTFVSSSGRTDVDVRATNKFVRSYVMRRYKRQKKAKTPQSEYSPQSADEESIPDIWSFGQFTNLTAPACTAVSPTEMGWLNQWSASRSEDRERQNIAIKQGPPASAFRPPYRNIRTWLDGEIDPFSSLPIHLNGRSFSLLQQNASSPLRTSVHADPSGIYRRVCSKDPAWMFMHLYYAACRFSQSSNGYNCEATQYLLQSQAAVSKTIRESCNAIGDSTIATVACLANIENLNGQASTAYVHMDGLKRMVQIRKGLSNLGIDGILRRMVLWSDLLTSLNLQIAPHFPLNVIEKPFALWELSPAHLRYKYFLTTNMELETITTQKHGIMVNQLLLSLHQLATFLNLDDGELLPRKACYPDRVYEVEYAVALSLYDDHVAAESGDKVELGQLLLQAALLYVYSNLRQTPVGGLVRKTLLSRLRALLNSMDVVHLSKVFTAEILWVLAVGISAASGASQVEFLEVAWEVCIENQIGGWTELTDALRSMPALLDDCMATCAALWLFT